MFAVKSRKTTLTLLCYFALVLAVASVAQADVSNHQARDHVGLSRMLRKRADLSDVLPGTNQGTSGAANDPPKLDSSSSAASATSASATEKDESTSSVASSTSASSASSSSSSSSSSIASSSSASSSIASSSAASSSSVPSSSAPPSTSSTAPTSTADSNNNNNNTPATQAPDTDTATHTRSQLTVSVTATASPTASEAPAEAVGASSQSFPKSALTVIIVLASCIGAVAIGWTIIRKWKFKKSSNFDDRMAPIDWQPSNGPDDGIPGLRRNVSTASHGSFQSSGHDENFAGRGNGGGYGAATDSTYSAPGTTQLQPIPDHDFTAGAATLAPVGGYADLARGPSPQPQMAELSRGPSVNHGYDSYGVPLHHQGAYDYNANPRY